MMRIIKIGIPCRSNKTVMYRRKAGEELSARFTSAPTANIPLTEKTTWLSTFVLIREKNLSHATIVLTVPPQRTNSYHISAHIQGRSHFHALTVVIVLPRKTS